MCNIGSLMKTDSRRQYVRLIRRWIRLAYVRCLVCVIREIKKLKKVKYDKPGSIFVVSIKGFDETVSTFEKIEFVSFVARNFSKNGYNTHIWIKDSKTNQARLIFQPKSYIGISEATFILGQQFQIWLCKDPLNAIVSAANAGANIIFLYEYFERGKQISDFSISLIKTNNITRISSILMKSDAIVALDNKNYADLTKLHNAVYKVNWIILQDGLKKKINCNTPIVGFTWLQDSGVFFRTLLYGGFNIKGFIPVSNLAKEEKQLKYMLSIAACYKAILVASDKDALFFSNKTKLNVCALQLEICIGLDLIRQIEHSIQRLNQNNQDSNIKIVKSASSNDIM
jgi:hypothetical protein